MFICKLEKLVSLMRSMAVVDEKNRLTGCILCLGLGDKIVLKLLKAMEVTCPSIIRKFNAILIKVIKLISDEQVESV